MLLCCRSLQCALLKLENSSMPRVKGQAGCRICVLFCASLTLVSWHWSVRERMAPSLEEWSTTRCGDMRCTVSCIASQAFLCSALDSAQRWALLLHVWQTMVSARGARRLRRTSCTACGPAGGNEQYRLQLNLLVPAAVSFSGLLASHTCAYRNPAGRLGRALPGGVRVS